MLNLAIQGTILSILKLWTKWLEWNRNLKVCTQGEKQNKFLFWDVNWDTEKSTQKYMLKKKNDWLYHNLILYTKVFLTNKKI